MPMAFATLIIGALKVPELRVSLMTAPEVFRATSISLAVAVGLAARSRATAPATCGAAMDVPQ